MKNRTVLVVVLLLVCVVITVGALLINQGSEFGGADGQAEEMIGEINPSYEPWASSIFELPSETETLLFCLQAGIGALIIGGGFGYLIARKKFKRDNV